MFYSFFRYPKLEEITRNIREKGVKRLIAKLIIDRLLFTPPFLVVSLSFINLLLTTSGTKAAKIIRSVYFITLITNWKVRTYCGFNI